MGGTLNQITRPEYSNNQTNVALKASKQKLISVYPFLYIMKSPCQRLKLIEFFLCLEDRKWVVHCRYMYSLSLKKYLVNINKLFFKSGYKNLVVRLA